MQIRATGMRLPQNRSNFCGSLSKSRNYSAWNAITDADALRP
jgi:hypothetical protein